MPALSEGPTWNLANSRSGNRYFPNPFCDLASLAMPQDIKEALYYCEQIIFAQGIYSAALRRVLSYFITEIKIDAPSGAVRSRLGKDETQKYLDYLNDTLGMPSSIHASGFDYLTYGISFTSQVVPFRRNLMCPREFGGCGTVFPARRVFSESRFKFRWQQFKFHAVCPQCRYEGEFTRIDRRDFGGELKIKRWSVHEIDVHEDGYSGNCRYWWKIPGWYRDAIRAGSPLELEHAPWPVIQAIQKDQHFLFEKDAIYCMKVPALCGLNMGGWGMSPVLMNARHSWLWQILNRQVEAVAYDHILPMRVISPAPQSKTAGMPGVPEPVRNISLGDLRGQVQRAIRLHRMDPTAYHFIGEAVQYQLFGADANAAVSKDLLEYATDVLLNAADVPVDLYRGSLTIQSAQVALRLFEAIWAHLVYNLNRFLQWHVEKVGRFMSWESVTASLTPARVADDLNRQMAQLQMMTTGHVSRQSGLAAVGMDFHDEERKKLEEEKFVAEATKEMQQEMEQAAMIESLTSGPPVPGMMQPGMAGMPGMAQGMPTGGQPGAASAAFNMQQPLQPNMPVTLPEIDALGRQHAEYALSLPESQKDSYLIRLSRQNPIVHQSAKAHMDKMRRAAELQGRDLVMQGGMM